MPVIVVSQSHVDPYWAYSSHKMSASPQQAPPYRYPDIRAAAHLAGPTSDDIVIRNTFNGPVMRRNGGISSGRSAVPGFVGMVKISWQVVDRTSRMLFAGRRRRQRDDLLFCRRSAGEHTDQMCGGHQRAIVQCLLAPHIGPTHGSPCVSAAATPANAMAMQTPLTPRAPQHSRPPH